MGVLRRCLAALPLCLALLPPPAAAAAVPQQRSAAAATAAAASSAAAADDAEGRVIVKYRAGSGLMRAAAASTPGQQPAMQPRHAAALGVRLRLNLQDRHVLGARTQALQARGIGAAELARRLAREPDVEWAEPVRRKTIRAVLPNDTFFGGGQTSVTPAAGQWYLRKHDATAVSAIDAVGAWAITLGSPAVTVAVLDTGVRFDHPDLGRAAQGGKLWEGHDFISRSATGMDGDGADADASDPGDWNNAGACGAGSAASSSSWHGTQVAGLVGAATDNAIGMAGAGRNVMVLPVRVLGQCGGFDDDIIAGMRWAAGLSETPKRNEHPARVLNLSLGSTFAETGACTAAAGNRRYVDVFNELAAAGVTVVVAGGNEGLAVGLPANCPGALTVGAVRHIGTKVGFSDVGPEVAISAPGGNCVNLTGSCLYPILTTTNAGTTTPAGDAYTDGSNVSVGTSFSAPLVAGAVGLMLSVDPSLTPASIRSVLQSSARAFPTSGAAAGVPQCRAPGAAAQLDECYCTASTCGAGLLDVAAAVALRPLVALAAPATAPVAGDPVTLDGSQVTAFRGTSVVGYQWAVTAGSAAVISGSSTAPTVVLATAAAGDVTVQLTVTDSSGATASSSVLVSVQPAPVAAAPSGGGGGAMSAGWLAGLGIAVALLWRRPPARRRRGALRAG